MAVDANVLIFERIREELRSGKTVRAAIDGGYNNALSAIVDANVTTFLVGIVLYQFGTGPIRGFALTLCIGILSSLFTAFFVTRTVFELMTRGGGSQSLSIGPVNFLANARLSFWQSGTWVLPFRVPYWRWESFPCWRLTVCARVSTFRAERCWNCILILR